MKAMTRKRLAACAGVSTDTLGRYIEANRKRLVALGYKERLILPPAVVRWIAANYGADLEE